MTTQDAEIAKLNETWEYLYTCATNLILSQLNLPLNQPAGRVPAIVHEIQKLQAHIEELEKPHERAI